MGDEIYSLYANFIMQLDIAWHLSMLRINNHPPKCLYGIYLYVSSPSNANRLLHRLKSKINIEILVIESTIHNALLNLEKHLIQDSLWQIQFEYAIGVPKLQ